MTYLTQTYSGLKCGDNIEADSWMEAEAKCPDGFEVIGELIETIDAPEFDNLNLN